MSKENIMNCFIALLAIAAIVINTCLEQAKIWGILCIIIMAGLGIIKSRI